MPTTAPEILDVLIVGAGISGIGAARHLQKKCPDKTWRIVEARERLGGTWDFVIVWHSPRSGCSWPLGECSFIRVRRVSVASHGIGIGIRGDPYL